LKILILNWRDVKNPASGGAEILTHEIAKRLVKKGHKVTLFTSSFKGAKENEVIDGVQIIRKGGKYTVYLQAFKYYNQHFKGEFDVVIDEINTIPFFTPLYVKNGEKLFTLIHQLAREFWFYETPAPLNLLGYASENLLLSPYKNTRVITVSKSTSDDLQKLGFSKISVIIEGSKFKPLKKPPKKEETPTLIYVGRLKNPKKPGDAVEAFKIIKKKIKNARLWIVGEGPLRKKLEQNSTEGVTFFGHVSKQKQAELMSKAHAILVPGVREGWGLVVIEANAMGTPAIGYNINGLRDSIKNGVNGFLTESNPQSLAEKAIQLLENKKLAKKLSVSAIQNSRKYNWNKSTEELIGLISKA